MFSSASFIAGVVAGCAATACVVAASSSIAHNQTKKEDDMTKATLLQAIALIAAAQNVAQNERVQNAELQNKLAQFQADHDLVNDSEVNDALGAVIRSAQVAPPSADSAHAVSVTEKFLDEDNDGKDDRTGKSIDEQNAGAGASGNSGLQTADDSAKGDGANSGGSSEDSQGSPAQPEGTPSPKGGKTQ